jgi:hypothetical protein
MVGTAFWKIIKPNIDQARFILLAGHDTYGTAYIR